MTSDFEKARTHAQLLVRFAHEENPNKDMSQIIQEQVETVFSIKPDWKATVDQEKLVKELETIFSTWIGEARTLEGNDTHQPWLHERRTDIDWRYWKRYRQFLQDNGWADATILRLDDLTDGTLGRLENPLRKEPWDRRGLLVGHVQSGKTSNYIGLISKAADAGYKLIIVLAGMHNSLRSQTQLRLDEGFLGYDSGTRALDFNTAVQVVGVGNIDPGAKRPDTITTRLENGDFKRSVAEHFNINPGGNPLLFVVKKNGSVLKNLLEWVEWAATNTDENGRKSVSGVPLLVIDDEADWGSVDTKDNVLDENGEPDLEHNPTILNQRIRKLLFSFDQCAYVGYTATPFANIFIHEKAKTKEFGEDLFPRSFITALPYPSNYISPVKLFGIAENEELQVKASSGLPIIRYIHDHALTDNSRERQGWMPPVHNSAHVPRWDGSKTVPGSLREAIRAFILVCAARMARGHINAHNSMLVHVTRFVNVQQQVYDQICAEMGDIQNRIKWGEGESKNSVRDDLKRLWENDFVPTSEAIKDPDCPFVPWTEIESYILKAASAITVRQINGSTADILDYVDHKNTGLSVIAVGGDKLSRGLTLEGLSISYFLRASKMYDTLMQMGRWFGYRPGYKDLCRLYTTTDIAEWLRCIAAANEELRLEFEHMAAVGGTPRDYGLRVRSHPQLLVTSRVKMRHGTTVEISFAGHISETISFYKDEVRNNENLKATENLFERIGRDGIKVERSPKRKRSNGKQSWEGSYCWSDVSSDRIKQFLKEYATHPSSHLVNCKLLEDYIEKQNENNDLTSWTVLLLSAEGKDYDMKQAGQVRLVKRAWNPDGSAAAEEDHLVIRRLVSPRDETIDLSEEAYSLALQDTISEWEINKGRSQRKTAPEEPSGVSIRNRRQTSHGVLLVYPLEAPEKGPKSNKSPVIGFAISFPGNSHDRKVTYVVNNIYYEQEYGLG